MPTYPTMFAGWVCGCLLKPVSASLWQARSYYPNLLKPKAQSCVASFWALRDLSRRHSRLKFLSHTSRSWKRTLSPPKMGLSIRSLWLGAQRAMWAPWIAIRMWKDKPQTRAFITRQDTQASVIRLTRTHLKDDRV